ncbi:hypothetical protein [uncultured Oceanisphaera sp.]|uniref:hypothetical protein n=1 Tax=uncultured Oceanisphaera sp. TaxID=353858 RepID=UPI002604082D|nr:hypothetical protein [uncultured Oceanisphaera sp.]
MPAQPVPPLLELEPAQLVQGLPVQALVLLVPAWVPVPLLVALPLAPPWVWVPLPWPPLQPWP